MVYGTVLVLLWLWIIDQTIKALGFYDNANLLYQSRLEVSYIT